MFDGFTPQSMVLPAFFTQRPLWAATSVVSAFLNVQ